MKAFYTLFIATLLTCNATAQGTIDFGIFAGLSNYGGDLSETSFEIVETNPAFGVLGRYNVRPWFSVRIGLTAGIISGSDLNAVNPGRRKRNLSFRTPIYELAVLPEFNIYSIELANNQTITPYAALGASVFYFNPRTLYEGEMIALQPLGTEGQGLPGYPAKYSRISAAACAGLGVRFAMNERASIALEFITRYAFTDYLDDVSTVYPDNALLAAASGTIAAALSDRTPEVTGIPSERPEGSQRGGAAKDAFYFLGATVSINIFSPEVMEKK